MIGFNLHSVLRLKQFHRGGFLNQFRHDADVIWIQVRHDDKCHSAVPGHVLEKSLESIQTPRRGTNADDMK
jgi:hypothetical protein